MKKLIPLILIIALLLCACKGGNTEVTEPDTTLPETTAPETTEPETEPTTVPETTEAPTEIRNPLNGEALETPYTGRVVAVTINNVAAAMPFKGVSQADVFFEMLVNDYATRGLALFTDIASVSDIGSLRSNRLNFTDICQAYDAVLIYSGGSDVVLNDLAASGVDCLQGENSVPGYRDQGRISSGYNSWDCLFVRGQQIFDSALKRGFEMVQPADKNYGLKFAEDGTPENGEDASKLTIRFWDKKTTMEYDATAGKYNYIQYGKYTRDENNGQNIAFENVIVMQTVVTNYDIYHVADIQGSGEGYFACNGKIVPIKWIHENETDPFTFTLADGTPLELGVGNTYIAFAPTSSTFEYE